MSLLKRIEKLEQKLTPKRLEVYWLMWRDCQWRESEGLIRYENESIEEFQERVLKTTDKQFIWVK
jgi:hypothetical protein